MLLEVVLNLSGSRWLRSSCRDVSYLVRIDQSGGDGVAKSVVTTSISMAVLVLPAIVFFSYRAFD